MSALATTSPARKAAFKILLAVERGQSRLVVGPTQSGKTTGIAVPALVEWDGPVVATSVKTDLVDAAMGARRRRGPVLVYDPLRISGHSPARWSPLAESVTWPGAKRVAAGLCAALKGEIVLPGSAACRAYAEARFATGMAAITGIFLTLLRAGDHIVSSRYVFGNTFT